VLSADGVLVLWGMPPNCQRKSHKGEDIHARGRVCDSVSVFTAATCIHVPRPYSDAYLKAACLLLFQCNAEPHFILCHSVDVNQLL
jgi:hypothetical protein